MVFQSYLFSLFLGILQDLMIRLKNFQVSSTIEISFFVCFEIVRPYRTFELVLYTNILSWVKMAGRKISGRHSCWHAISTRKHDFWNR